jgi:hypothetical protein
MHDIVNPPKLHATAHGLLRGANIVTPTSDTWENGIQFTPIGCSVLHAHDPLCWVSGVDTKTGQECPPLVQFKPYTIEANAVWANSDRGFDLDSYVKDALEVGTGSILERLQEFGVADVASATALTPPAISGTIATIGIKGRASGTNANPILDDAIEVAASSDPRICFGSIESKLLDASDHIGSVGSIYMGPTLAALLWGSFVTVEGQLYSAATGSKIIIGNYTPGKIYGHVGDVNVYLSDPKITEAYNHGENERIVMAERLAIAAWNPCATFVCVVS